MESGWNTLSLQTGGRISDNAQTDTIGTANLAARAGNGITLDTSVSNLAVRNTNSGDITVRNTSGLTLIAFDTLNGTAGNELGNFASDGGSGASLESAEDLAANRVFQC